MIKASEIKSIFRKKLVNQEFVIDKTGSKLLEMVGVSFEADQDYLIREPNYNYIGREIEWYKSQSRDVRDIPGNTPQIWLDVSSKNFIINSNYGWCVWSDDNYHQFDHAANTLISNPDSRRAVMIYTRPSMQTDYNRDGMSDFMCTHAQSFLIRDNKLITHYIMRSNDSVFGYNNDFAWARHIQLQMLSKLKSRPEFKDLELGKVIWTATSLHVYERHFDYLN